MRRGLEVVDEEENIRKRKCIYKEKRTGNGHSTDPHPRPNLDTERNTETPLVVGRGRNQFQPAKVKKKNYKKSLLFCLFPSAAPLALVCDDDDDGFYCSAGGERENSIILYARPP